jgi:predicted PurR-regulated permease PerM
MDGLTQFLAAWTPRRVITGTLVVLSVIAIAYIMIHFYSVLVVIFIAFVISTAIRPLVNWLGRFKINPSLGVIIAYLLLLGILIGIVVVLAPIITHQLTAITGQIPKYYTDFRGMLSASRSAIIRTISTRLPSDPPMSLIGVAPNETAAQDASVAVGQLLASLGNVGVALFTVIATLLLGFYWTLEGERVQRTLLSLVSTERREGARQLVAEIQQTMGAYVRGQIILDISIGVMATIAYFMIGLENALVLGILAGILETVPILGPVLGAVPPALIALASGNTNAFIWVVVATVIIQQAEGTFLVPRVMDRTVGVNAVVTLLAFAAFSSLLGLAGGILAVPLAAILQIIFWRLVFAPVAITDAIKERDKLSVLRYEAQDLAQTMRLRTRDPEQTRRGPSEELNDQLEDIVLDLDQLLERASLQKASS